LSKIRYWILKNRKLVIFFSVIFLLILAFFSIYWANTACFVQIFGSRGARGWINSGTIFAVVAGILTLLALLYAVLKIETLSTHMVSFDVLMDKLIEFAEGIKDNEEIFALFQTPLIGNITFDREPSSSTGGYNPKRISKAGVLAEVLRDKINNLNLICLEGKNLNNFYLLLRTSTGLTKEALERKAEEAEGWLISLDKVRRQERIRYYKTLEDSPDFHLIFTSKRGFLFLPLFVPGRDSGIEMFSFEAADPIIIASHFKKVFNYYWSDEKSSPAICI